MLNIIGLGLSNERDVTLNGLAAIRRSKYIYLESYTSILSVPLSTLENLYGKELIPADRETVESGTSILSHAAADEVSLLIVGDPFSATTHTDLVLRCREHNPPIKVKTFPNASILTAIGATGLSLYKFGQTVSMPFFSENWKPESWYDRLKGNSELGLHSLVLLDIKVRERDWGEMVKGRVVYEEPRYMSVRVCARQMVEIEEGRGEGVCERGRLGVGVARLGAEDEKIVAGTLGELCDVELGEPLHSVVVCGRMHEMEWLFLREFAVDKEGFDEAYKERGYAE
ncbi:Diphthine synthase [Piedraia hortae CBS 480.64]|uniref:diphthine methyl ester synthase n=1 Tax=Piedraia hortae CBS 480.64 TaxID=1314780 RepID=A0A6A7BWL0_9PEZI|nr:Diphthine synthase [Piedraia hortae CBS 480.64]